jgi:hypothetical protein
MFGVTLEDCARYSECTAVTPSHGNFSHGTRKEGASDRVDTPAPARSTVSFDASPAHHPSLRQTPQRGQLP